MNQYDHHRDERMRGKLDIKQFILQTIFLVLFFKKYHLLPFLVRQMFFFFDQKFVTRRSSVNIIKMIIYA